MSLEVLISEEALQARIGELAQELDDQRALGNLGTDQPVLLIGVLKGSIHFLSDLSRKMKQDSEIDFMQTSSYGAGKSSIGVVQIRKDLDINIEDRDVIIVEDIVDTGTTLSYLREMLSTRSPRSLRVVALLSKPEARKVKTPVEFIGFEIRNEFVVGYGLDFAEKYRNLPYVAILREE